MPTRAGLRTRVVFALLLSLFAAAVALYAREELRGGPWRSHLLVAAPAEAGGLPVVVGFGPGIDGGDSGMRPGDRLVRAGERELAGAWPWTVYAGLYAEAGAGGEVEIEAVRDGARLVSRERLDPLHHVWRDVALALCFAVTALLILRRAPALPMARAFAAAALVWGIAQVQFQGASPLQTYAYFGVRAVTGLLWAPLMILAAIRFPEGARGAGEGAPRWPWLFAVLGLTWTSWWMSVPFPADVASRANPAIGSAVIAAVLVVATRNYALAGPLGRRQVKWVLLGCYVGLAPGLVGTTLGALRPDLTTVWFASQAALVAIPISIFIAVTRSQLLDIDRLISGTASYTVLLVALGAGALTALPWLAERASERAGIDLLVVQVGLGGVLAFAVVRAEPLLRPHFERLFFAERQVFQRAIDRLVHDVQEAPDASSVATLVGERLDELLRPQFCVVYARGAEVFAPVFSRRCAITPHFDPDCALVAALSERASAVDLDRDRSFARLGTPAERAELQGLDPAVLVPVVRERTLVGFVALGRKASGDVYTPTDLALLGLVAGGASLSITRFDDEELLRASRSLQEKLRQYVPASIADHLASGRELEPGVCDVTILFADLRGYASLVEGRVADEIFRLVSQYTEVVTRIVSDHGGTVVEFNGDGMMAVFGAPSPLPDKERRALAAARRVVGEVSALKGFSSQRGGTGELAVGVGVATGSAYVGAIRSVDRHIWSAIGNTTNLAARLQDLTREFDAPIVIDDATHRATSSDAADFECRAEMQIRGLRATRDVFVLPRERAAA